MKTMSPPNKPSPRFLTIDQIANELNVGLPQVRALLKNGELRAIQIGARGQWRIGVQDFENYIIEAYRQTAERIEAGLVEESPVETEA